MTNVIITVQFKSVYLLTCWRFFPLLMIWFLDHQSVALVLDIFQQKIKFFSQDLERIQQQVFEFIKLDQIHLLKILTKYLLQYLQKCEINSTILFLSFVKQFYKVKLKVGMTFQQYLYLISYFFTTLSKSNQLYF